MSNIPPPASWPIECSEDGSWRHINHDLRLATAGWGSKEAAERNADLYRVNDAALRIMSERYETLFPAPAPKLM
jgi:hypothetical protein